MNLNELARMVHATAKSKGWYDKPRPIPELLCLIHSEISEALEAYRNHDDENFAEELADTIIRILDLCAYMSIDIEGEVLDKNEINKLRPYMHGGKRC